jgi:hypothetical protein
MTPLPARFLPLPTLDARAAASQTRPREQAMTDDEAQGAGVAAWLLVRALTVELADAGVLPPKRLRKLVSSLLEAVTELDRADDLSNEARRAARQRLEELRRSPSLNPGAPTPRDRAD